MNKDDKVQEWLAAERAAVSAEMKVAELGQAAQDPRVATLFAEARDKRQHADALFQQLYQFARTSGDKPGA